MLNSHTRRAMAVGCSRIVMVLGAAAAVAQLTGCSSSSSRASGGSVSGAVSDYHAQHYGSAHDQASAVMAKSTGTQREQAAYVAGLSAYQSGDFDAAESDLSTAAVSSDPKIAGNAKAMLGQIALDQHRPRQAASYFADASRLLSGEDARQAAWHAGLAYRQAGDEASAKRWLDTASGSQFDSPRSSTVAATPSAGSTRANSTLASSSVTRAPTAKGSEANSAQGQNTLGYALQVGAFGDKGRAKRAAEDAESLAKREKLGRVRIIPRRDARGQPMYLVQVGWWVTRSEADSARSKIGKLEYIVAPSPV